MTLTGILTLCIVLVAALLLFRAATMVVTTTWAITETGEGTGIGGSVSGSHTGENVIAYTLSVPVSTTDEDNDVQFRMADLQAIVITTNTDVTIKVNSAGAPTDTLLIKATVPFVWEKDSGVPAPIVGTAGVVSKFFVSNVSATVVAAVRVRGVQNT